MSDTLTLAHISDVHLSLLAGFHPRYWNMKRGLGYINWHRKRRFVHSRSVADMIAADALMAAPDHIAVTGDLANIGLPGEYETALAWLNALGPPEKVSAVPGNHDIYTHRMHGASCLERWAPFMTSDTWGRSIGGSNPGIFPFVRRIGPAAIIGLNSAVPTPVFVAAGEVGTQQLTALGPILDAAGREGLVRVVLIHHPPLPGQAPPRRGLKDAPELERVLSRHGTELVLHGHNHQDSLAWRTWSNGHVPVVGVASGSAARVHKDEPPARYNLIRIARDGRNVAIECVTRGLADDGQSIEEIGRRRLDPAGLLSGDAQVV